MRRGAGVGATGWGNERWGGGVRGATGRGGGEERVSGGKEKGEGSGRKMRTGGGIRICTGN